MRPIEVLRNSKFGSRTAEEEQDNIENYFVKTEQWRRVLSDDIDIVYGQKGSGKSAIYSLIIKREKQLKKDRKILVIPGERPQGAPAFSSLKEDHPRDEGEFVNLWKIYFITLIGKCLKDSGINNNNSRKIINALEKEDLIPSDSNLQKYLKYAFDYIKSIRKVKSVEGGASVDPVTYTPSFTAKIVFSEPSHDEARRGLVSVDDLFQAASDALKEGGFSIWILLDRLDVAFSESIVLETMALRALFRSYLDIKHISNIRLKVFLRTDIWQNITENGFREASHIERNLTIQWNDDDLNNIIIRRVLHNDDICQMYGVDSVTVMKSRDHQSKFWDRVFPKQVDSGPNKPSSFKWILGRTRDASQRSTPRELIHFLNELRDRQIIRLERSERGPIEDRLFEQVTFKDALPEVSRVRLQQTLYAEYPAFKDLIEKLKDQKATQSNANLAKLWQVDEAAAGVNAANLEKIGFFEKFGKDWRVPFIYRPALNLVQGASE